MPWAESLSLSDNKLFIRPKHNIYTFFMILFGLFDLKLFFVCKICHVNYETKNLKIKEIYLKKIMMQFPFSFYKQSLRFEPGDVG